MTRRPELAEIELEAWGDGAAWMLDQAPAMLGDADDVTAFASAYPVIQRAWARNPNWRVPRTGRVLEALLPAVIEQKVTGQEAWLGFRRLVTRFGAQAPGPAGERGMRCQPEPSALIDIPSWEWLRCHIDGKRSQTIVRSARRASSLERTLDLPVTEADVALRSIAGIGVWTSAEIRQRAFGDADAVSFGDYHIAPHVGYALLGELGADDDRLRELLRDEAPHRYRVQHVATTRLPGPPRHGPRMAPRRHLPA